MESHDHNFKTVFQDFPEEALEWILPDALQKWGPVRKVEFVRQEPKKRRLSDPNLILDMPILYTLGTHQLLLWLVEFQEDRAKFSIYKLLIYTAELMEAHPEALVIPTVLFTDRKKWRKNVTKKLETKLNDRLLMHFEYVFVKLFDFNARDYYHIQNPVVKILLPKMKYEPEERWEVIRQAYIGLYQIAPMLFEKYADFIDIYAEVSEKERYSVLDEIKEHKETVMILQMLKKEYIQEGRQEGRQEGNIMLLSRQLEKKYHVSPEKVSDKLQGLKSEHLLDLGERILECDSFEDIDLWIQERKQKTLDS